MDDNGSADQNTPVPEASVFESAFPGRRITDLSVLDSDGPCSVFTVTTADGDQFVLKYAGDRSTVPEIRREVTITNYVRCETSVPVVEPVSYNVDRSSSEGYLTTRWADGQTLDETLEALPPHVHPQVFANVGETLATLHTETSFESPGEIEPTGPQSFEVESTGDWPELFAHRLADHVETLQGTRFEDVAEDVWSYVSGRLEELDTGESPVLLHGDIGDGNLVYDGTSVSHILDWERGFVGHPEYDLCRAEVRYFLNNWGRESQLQAMLYEGYRSVRDIPAGFDDRRQYYLATFYLMPLATYPDWAPAFTDDLDGFAERVAEKVRGILG